MKKGEIYEGVIEKVDFPNKGTEGTLYDPEKTFRQSTGTNP